MIDQLSSKYHCHIRLTATYHPIVMSATKDAEAARDTRESTLETDYDEALPKYEADAHATTVAETEASQHRPTTASPFDFPVESDAPPVYASEPQPTTESSSASCIRENCTAITRTIAIPQINQTPAAPLLDGYPPSLISHGITQESWCAFISTTSAFLSAKISDKAIRHAADMGRVLAQKSSRLSKDTVTHAKTIGHRIKTNARGGSVLGTAIGTITGSIALSVGLAVRTTSAVISAPNSALRAVVLKPRTPKERATAYAAAANKDWLIRRGLVAQVLDSVELSALVHVPVDGLTDAVTLAMGPESAASNILEPLQVDPSKRELDLSPTTLWLVIMPCERDFVEAVREVEEPLGERRAKEERQQSSQQEP